MMNKDGFTLPWAIAIALLLVTALAALFPGDDPSEFSIWAISYFRALNPSTWRLW